RPPAREIVLALGGGAARAAAHLGVLRVLRRAGIGVAGIAGTSAGALVGAMYFSGMNEDEILNRFTSFTTTPLFRQMRRAYAEYVRRAKRVRPRDQYFRQSGLAFLSDSDPAAIPDSVFAAFIEHFAGPDRDISRLGKPFGAVATDLV